MKKVGIIIKHPGRDFDWRVDIVEVEDDVSHEDIEKAVKRDMLGPFEVVGISSRICLDRKLNL